MPVKIDLLDSYQLKTQQDNPNLLLLPTIEIEPAEDSNLPHIFQIEVSVTGTPEDLAEQIQSVYKSVDFNTNNPLKLTTQQKLKQTNCKWDKPLPLETNCTLRVTVGHFDSNAEGSANFSESKKSTSECKIRTSLVEDNIGKLKDLPIIPVEDTVTTSIPKPELINNNKKSVWLAIDFGTSNSTVTLWEPKLVVEPKPWFSAPEQRLSKCLAEWLTKRPIDNLPRVSSNDWENEWNNFFKELDSNLQNINLVNIQNLQGEQLLEFSQQVEIALCPREPWFCRAASKRLYKIYREVFSLPLLEWQSLIPVELDKVRRLTEIPSELEVISLEYSLAEDNPAKVNVFLGEQAKNNRKRAIRDGENIEGRFLHSPKRYFGQNHSLKISLNGKENTIPVNKLLQGAYAQLIQLSEDYRQSNPDKCAQSKLYGAVVTYPTIASPFVRHEIESLVSQLGISTVQMAYDEAVSVALFFLWKKFGGNLNVGLESFKTRCRKNGDNWWQNVLVLDIGGGTTDIALMRLTLEEIPVFKPGEDRGDGGRYYKLTPKLLGSSGHLQLGGELITLQLFHLLKAAIADCLLTAVAEERLAKNVLKVQPNELYPRFVNKDKFQKGALLACVDTEIREGEAYQEALKDAEKVLSTKWENKPLLVQPFYDLWEYAEDAKKILGQKRQKDTPDPFFVLNGQKISDLLKPNNIKLPSDFIDSLSVTLTVEQFAKAAKPYIQEAIGIAKGLVDNTFKNDKNELSFPNNSQEKEQLDWLILSGKTCNLELVKHELYRLFSQSKYFVWNEERVTFEPEYTKLATSAGACLAEKFRQLSFNPKDATDLLRKGANQLYIDVKNLFYFLPCSFEREVIGENIIFKTGQALYQLQAGDEMAKHRSDNWQGMQLTVNIKRKDFENMGPHFWGSYNGNALMKELGMNEHDFKDKIKVQFEINQKLDIDLLLCKGNPHYLIPVDTLYLDVAQAIGNPEVISKEGKVICDIAVNVAESANALKTDVHNVLFDANKDYSKELSVFRDNDNTTMQQQGKGLIAKLPRFPLSGQHTFYFKFHNLKSDQWELIGELPEPKVKTDYEYEYYVSLNEKGILRVHAFEVPYWISTSKECLKQEGCVFRDTLQLDENSNFKKERDPFSGIH